MNSHIPTAKLGVSLSAQYYSLLVEENVTNQDKYEKMYARKPRLDLTYGRLGESSQHQTIKAINSGHFFQPNSICLIMQKVFLVSHVTKNGHLINHPLLNYVQEHVP